MRIRVAESEDIAGLTTLINTAFRRAESFIFHGDRIDSETVRSLTAKGRFLVVEDKGVYKGCVYVEVRGERAYLGLLSVDPREQGSGIGSALMAAAEEDCAREGCCHMDLKTVNLRMDNRAFYGRRGYVETGTELLPADLITKLPCHFVHMSKQLV